MSRRVRRSYDSSSATSAYSEDENADPRVGLVNLADVMLVFACGLMVAIVAHWGVNLSAVQAISTDSAKKIEDIQKMAEDMKSAGGGYDKLGMVYQDPNTGTMYLLQEGDDDSGGKSDSSSKSGK